MNLIEFDAKTILRDAGLPVPHGVVARSDDLVTFDHPVVLKAQIPAGGRGKQGLVVPAGAADGQAMLAVLRERMRELGFDSPLVLVEDRANFNRECYLAWCIDDVAQSITLLFSAHGGIHVEEHAGTIEKLHFAPTHTPGAHEFAAFFERAGFSGRALGALCRFATASWRVFVQADAQLIEINPLAITARGEVIVLDAKIAVDDNALPRHGEWPRLYSAELSAKGMSDLERRAADKGFTFVEMSGEVAVFAGGAGIGMALLDLLADAGMPAANFADASGGSGGATFEQLGRLTFERAERPDVKAILMYFTLAATSLADVMDGLMRLLDHASPPKPLVIGLLSSGAAERDLSFAQAQQVLGARGYRCARGLPGIMAALGELRWPGAVQQAAATSG